MTKKLLPLKIIASQITEIQLETVLQTIDRLHDAATADMLADTCTMDATLVLGWLEDIIYTAQEAITEIQASQSVTENKAEIIMPAVVRMYRQG